MRAPLLGKRVENLLDSAAHDSVDGSEISRKCKHRHDHDQRGRPNLLPRRPRDALHLKLELFEIVLNLRGPSRGFLRHAKFFGHYVALSWAWLPGALRSLPPIP